MVKGGEMEEPEVALLSGDQPGYLRLPPERMQELFCNRPIHEVFEVEEEPFARGKYAAVRRCKDRATGASFAAKFLRKRRRSADLKPEIVHEVAVLEACAACPRIVQLYKVLESATEMVLVLELAPGGELQMLLDRDEVPEEVEAARLMSQILDGIAYLHSINVAHLDIKPQNLVLTGEFPQCDVKLCDFGISRYISKGADIREILGTPDYVAPEVLNYEPISLATDMWSVGVLLYVLLTGCSPFGGDTKQETFCNISQSKLDFPSDLFGDISEEAIDLIKKLLVKEPSKRLSAKGCLQHEWFSKLGAGNQNKLYRSPSIKKSAILTDANSTTKSVSNEKIKPKREECISLRDYSQNSALSFKKSQSPPPKENQETQPQNNVESEEVKEPAKSPESGISSKRRNCFVKNMEDILKRLDDTTPSMTPATPSYRTKALAQRTMPANATYSFTFTDRSEEVKAPEERKSFSNGINTDESKEERHYLPTRQKSDCIYKIRRCYIEDTDEEEDDDDIPPPLPPSQPPPQLPRNAHLRLIACGLTSMKSPSPSSSSGCSSASSSAEGHSDHGSDTNSDVISEMSGDSSSDRSSIISLDDSLDIPYSKKMTFYSTSYSHTSTTSSSSSSLICDSWESAALGSLTSKQRVVSVNQQHLTSPRAIQANFRHPGRRSECSGSLQRAFSRFEQQTASSKGLSSTDSFGNTSPSSLLAMRTLGRFDRSVPSGLNEIGNVKKCGVQLEREKKGNVVVIRELKGGKFSRFSEVKCESVQARIKKLQEQVKS
ncbi:death-associated protein kinase related-like [Ischnura elegans]|uniref:death-associated protein kinase related-like n=1 Tax=Ischnura elegans TaxID=197161 RepID=UPI001ED8B227|nr:death-associated protein kinase related-like [Ischnura elegans]